jgi:multidrug efflux system outer membrane protein
MSIRPARIDARRAGIALSLALSWASQAAAQPVDTKSSVLSINLPTALRLADERNLDVAIYVARIAEADAKVAQARTLAVPSVRAGSDYDRHTGNIQETSGQVIDADRASRFSGAGIGLTVDLANAIFAPLVAKQNRAAVTAASTANRHRVFLDVATAYLRFLQSRVETTIVHRALERATDLATLTANYAQSGEGLKSDAEMAAVQPLLWQQHVADVEERTETTAAELVRLLHLEPGVMLEPMEKEIPTLELFSANEDVGQLISHALADRPETEQYDALVAAAEDDLNAQRYKLFIPGVALDYSTGRFGGGPGSAIDNTGNRDDLALTLYWQFDSFGLGHRARTNEKRAELQRIGLERDKLRDSIAAEVSEDYARVRSLKQQVGLAGLAVAHAQQAYALNRSRIYDRQGLPLEAQQAMQALAAAEVAELQARVDYALAQIRLHTALGNPLDSQFR